MGMIINIPKTLVVGYNERKGTYTGKLAYVVYLRKKAVKEEIAKERSWRGWIDEKLGVDKFDNVPTEGFVLNKKVGDYHYSWYEQRQAKIRVYDPRGFEFEITPDNLLWILECCSSIKGKGLEGEFVYGWDGADLLLVPCASSDYIESLALTEKRETKKIKASDLIVGHKYKRASNGKTIVYIGKRRLYKEFWSYNSPTIDEKYDGVRTPVERDKYVYCKDSGNVWWFLNDDNDLFYVPSVPNNIIDDGLGVADASVIAAGLEKLNKRKDTVGRDYKNDRLEPMTYDEFTDAFCNKISDRRYLWDLYSPFYTIKNMDYQISPSRSNYNISARRNNDVMITKDELDKPLFRFVKYGSLRQWGYHWNRDVVLDKDGVTARDIYDFIQPAWRIFAYADGTVEKRV